MPGTVDHMDLLLFILALIAFIIAAGGVFFAPQRIYWAGVAYLGLAFLTLTFIV